MTVSSQTEPPLLEMRGVGKHYRGVAALTDINFDLRRGEVHAILGENGAGKSTLVKILAGAVTPTQGEIRIDGQRIEIASPSLARRYGIAMVYQETSLVPSMTVAQNLYLGDEKFFNRLRGTYIDAQQFLQSLNFPVDPTATVQSLGTAKRQMVEIARAVRLKAKVIIFDEPTATLTPEEKHHLFALIDRLRKDQVSIIFISHALEEALEISDRITILRDGAHVVTDDARSFTRETIIRHMVGRSLTNELYGRAGARAAPRPAGAKVLSVENLSMQNQVRNTSFSIFAGQVTGRLRSGRLRPDGDGEDHRRRRQARRLSWRRHPAGDRSVRYRTPRAAVGDGVVYVTEDRKGDGLFETMSVADNIYVGQIAGRESRGILARHERKAGACGTLDQEAQYPGAEQRRAGHRTLRRQSAEGRDRQVPGSRSQVDHFRRADARRGRRRHSRNPPFDRRARRRRPRRRGDFVLPAGDPEPVGSHPRFEAGPNCRRAFAGRGDLRDGHVRGLAY